MKDSRELRHALRTPLNHIIGYSQMLMEDAKSENNSGALEELGQLLRAGQQLLDVIETRFPPVAGGAGEEDLRALLRESSQPLDSIRKHANTLIEKDFAVSDLRRIISATETLQGDLERARITGAEPPERAHRSYSGRFLVVDDDETNRDILRRQLERQGYAIETAPGGREALGRLSESSFDLLLLDIVMPGMDGFQVLAELKAHPRLRHVPVIVISAMDEMESVSRCIEMGADDFISKPFDRVILRARIGAVAMRREIERERAQLIERFRLLLESTGEGIFGINPAGNCTFINAAAIKMLNYSRGEILNRPFHELILHSRADGSPCTDANCSIRRAAEVGEACRITDETFYRKGGKPFPVEYSANPILHEGELQGAVITFADISERKRNEEKFRESAKLESLGVLAGGVAHDFNNLLTGILGNASLVLYSPDLPASDREKLEQVVKASESAAELTRQMLAYAGKGKFEIKPVDLVAMLRENEDLLRTLAPGTVHLRFDLPDDLPAVEADPSQMQQVAMNLVINAGEAIGEPRPGVVSVQAYQRDLEAEQLREMGFEGGAPGQYFVLQVSDTGSGMPPEVLARIFEPFYSTKFAGRGLGLAAVQGIVKSHNGAIQVESIPGKGTTFRVYLPASLRLAAPSRGNEKKAGSKITGCVLVVDDEEVIRATTQAVLASAGHQALTAANGEDAISVFKKSSAGISLVLLDMMMPGMGGDEVLKYLRAIRPDVPVIISSGFAEAQVMKYFAGRRVSGFIQKPYSAGGLLELVGSVLGRGARK